MVPFFSTAAMVIATVTAPTAPASNDAAQAVPAPVPVVAAAQSRRRRHSNEGVSVRPGTSSDDQAIEQQMQMRVLMPPLSGDGGG
jgi:hypothetical protein